jgi:hypothetical protein
VWLPWREAVSAVRAGQSRARSRPKDARQGDIEPIDCQSLPSITRIRQIEQHPKGSAEDKRRLIGTVLDCNREVLEHLRERGHGAAVE